MFVFINIIAMIVSGLLFLFFYVKSVQPKKLSLKIGERAYKVCGLYRTISMIFMFIAYAGYFVYYHFPLQINFPQYFPWSHVVSIIIGLLIGIPMTILMIVGLIDAGMEAVSPQKDQTLYKGIYTKMKHPQAFGELFIWFATAFVLNSPFLLLFSLIWIPVWILLCVYEEKDLLLRYGNSYKEYLDMFGFLFVKKS